MPATHRNGKPEHELAALYRRRQAVTSLIQALERYQAARVRRIRTCQRELAAARS